MLMISVEDSPSSVGLLTFSWVLDSLVLSLYVYELLEASVSYYFFILSLWYYIITILSRSRVR